MSAGRRGWGKEQRLLRASEFAALAGAVVSWRAARHWLALSVRIEPQAHATVAVPRAASAAASPIMIDRVRFGLTVPKRQAKRAVARNMVKRVLRESARHAAPALCRAAGPLRADVLLRLKAPLPAAGAASWAQLHRELRREADALLGQLQERLRRAAQGRSETGGAQAGTAQAREAAGRVDGQGAAPLLAQSSEGAPAPGDKSAGAQS